VADADHDRRCYVCGTQFAANPPGPMGSPGAAPIDPPPVYRQTRTDLTWLTWLLAIFGAIGGFGILSMAASDRSGTMVKVVLVAGFVLAAVMGVVFVVRPPETRFNDAGKVVLWVLAAAGIIVTAIVALVIGLFILLLAVCATGGRIAG
jgi:hypothetical protein